MDRLLPDAVLADVLSRLPQRSLAVSRAVCKCLRDIIDDHSLLRANLLPLSLAKIFTNFEAMELSEFFYPVKGPATAAISHSSLLRIIEDHCNGLVLIKYVDYFVMNPVTLQGLLLPRAPPPSAEMKDFYKNGVKYLVFDPTVAPDYEVFLIPHVPRRDKLGLLSEGLEWPPSPFILSVYSSRTKHWEQRPFVRKGGDIGSIGHILQDGKKREKHYGVYLRGALYVHCQNDYFYKISPSKREYQVIKPPPGIETSNRRQVYLGKSRNEVRCAIVDRPYKLQVWIMDESRGQYEWVMKHHIDIMHVIQRQDNQQVYGPWSSQEYYYDDAGNDMKKAPKEYCYDYISKHNEERSDAEGTRFAFLGFHPFNKDVVFLTDALERGFAYHLESSTVEHLEKLKPKTKSVYYNPRTFVEVSFPFTPCLTGELS